MQKRSAAGFELQMLQLCASRHALEVWTGKGIQYFCQGKKEKKIKLNLIMFKYIFPFFIQIYLGTPCGGPDPQVGNHWP